MVSILSFRVFFLSLKRHLLVLQMFHRNEVRMNICGREIPDIFNLTDAPKMANLLHRTENISITPIPSLRKHPFFLALRRCGRFARRNVCD